MTKKELEEAILEYQDAGMGRAYIADLLNVSKRYVDSVVRRHEYERRMLENVGEEWQKVVLDMQRLKRVREEAERKKKEEEGKRSDVIFIRCSAWSGYWWQRGFDFSRPDHRGEK